MFVWARIVLTGLASFAGVAAALAGTYQCVSITGGSAVVMGTTYNYSNSGGSRGYSGAAASGTTGCNLSGTITASFKWVPDYPNDAFDVPPSSVIVLENTSASLSFSASQYGSYTIDDGIDTPLTGTYNSINGFTESGSRSSIQSGSAFSVTCQPRVLLTLFGGGAYNVSPVLSYSVDVIYPVMSTSGTTQDATYQLCTLVGQGLGALVNTRAVFGAQNGVITSAAWDVGNADACAGFTSPPNTGHLIPYVAPPTNYLSTHWYYYKGVRIDGTQSTKGVSALTTVSAAGRTINCTLAQSIKVYGPQVNQSPSISVGNAYAVVDGSEIEENSGGIQFNSSPGTSTPGYLFDYNNVQLCCLDESAGFNHDITTNDENMLDNAYPYGLSPFQDDPSYDHTSNYVTSSHVSDTFSLSQVCRPSGSADAIWVTYGYTLWTWTQDNSPDWTTPVGGIPLPTMSYAMIPPLEWNHVFTNVNIGGQE
jgi:hypothetical protein